MNGIFLGTCGTGGEGPPGGGLQNREERGNPSTGLQFHFPRIGVERHTLVPVRKGLPSRNTGRDTLMLDHFKPLFRVNVTLISQAEATIFLPLLMSVHLAKWTLIRRGRKMVAAAWDISVTLTRKSGLKWSSIRVSRPVFLLGRPLRAPACASLNTYSRKMELESGVGFAFLRGFADLLVALATGAACPKKMPFIPLDW